MTKFSLITCLSTLWRLSPRQPGKTVSDPGFLSTSLGVPFDRDTLFVFTLSKGHGGGLLSGLSAYENETEMLFPPGTSYRVDAVISRPAPDQENNEDNEDFEKELTEIVSEQEERERRYGKVQRIIKATILKPKPNSSGRI